MSAVLYIGVLVVVLAAVAFAVAPLWLIREHRPGEVGTGSPSGRATQQKGRPVLAAALALFLLGIGGGTYWMLGQPYLAWRSAQGTDTRDVNGLIGLLIKRVRAAPDDLQAWVYLGRGYMGVGDAGDAAKAYGRAVALANNSGHPDAGLDTLYGEALVAQANGEVGAEAEAAFRAALKLDPKEQAARYFIAQAQAARGDKQGALTILNELLAETPDKSPLRQTLIDRIALLTAQGGGGAPDPKAMVAGLAARLKDNPDDAAGWQRLIRAYSVLGQRAEAQEALATARKTFAGKSDVLAELDAQAKELKLD
ncbi:MAG: tetratricopeptide repeat protein [Proteobacteria bacterium]|nr:tetratricopeptide repeat protein [Pseudomonadota bacterium]